jgi:hypothetical protein
VKVRALRLAKISGQIDRRFAGLAPEFLTIGADAEQHQYDLHKIDLATWRLLCRSAPDVELNLEKAKHLVEEQAHISCGVPQLKFKWQKPRSAPTPGRAW